MEESVHVFHRAASVKLALRIRSLLDCGENSTTSSEHIVLHFDQSDR